MLRGRGLQRQLAQVLYALRRGVDNIQRSVYVIFYLDRPDLYHRSFSLPATPLVASVSRLYHKLDGTEVSITFLSVFHEAWDKPIFNVKLGGTFEALAKLGKTCGVLPKPHGTWDALAKMTERAYGTGVHQFLAKKGFAPQLFGECTLESRPTVHVMDKLDDTWMTLEDWGKTIKAEQRPTVRVQVRGRIMEIINLLERKTYVHGDLRTANIMVEKDTGKLQIIDFDWAGKAGHTCYPIDRNDTIKDWPQGSKQGYPIALGHDRSLVENWLKRFLV